ncbi:MAG: N-6 DNA methylase, partial [Gemmatimonadetes bacterium]|nr:N-6 DNA methylase [Gemmatimonadota bacterium]
MARRSDATLHFDALALEGGLLPPEWLGKVAALEAPAQAPADYGIKKGLQLRDEITRYWRIAEALWGEFAAARVQRGHDDVAVTRTFVRQLLVDAFGFDDLAEAGVREAGGRRFPLDYEARGGRVPVVVGSADLKLDDSVPRHGDGHRRRSAWGALQEYLNASDDALWGLASNGLRIRLGRDNASLTRPAWLEADLERIFTEERFADFSVLWLVLHASRFGRPGQPVTDCPLEAWRAAAAEQGSRARDALRTGVEAALLELGQGFLSANPALRELLASGALTPQEYFNELLRLVYRMIFLLTVEERGILHRPDTPPEALTLYAEGYGMRRLRERSLRRAQYDRHTDLWASLGPVFTALGRPEGEPALGLPGLGGLFDPDQCPHLDRATLENRSLLAAIFRLAWLREGGALVRVNWKDMGPEELGSVYESLLELVPVVSDDGRRFSFAGADESAGNARKLTGSYYTPDSLVQQLLDTALMPVVRERLAAHPEDPQAALLSITVIDPACGSGHFLLAAARRLAAELARVRAGGTPGADEYRHALRDVVTHCIHGVDRNPMALELARMALWLETYTPDRALGFL